MKNAHEFPGLYDDLFDLPNAGYVMIDVGSPWVESPKSLEKYGYVSDDPNLYWMKGLQTKWHVTARGPLDPKVRQSHCKQVLESVELPADLELGHVEIFPSPYPDQKYDCFVYVINDSRLININSQLAVLPGVQTYIPYKAHITLGYFKQEFREDVWKELDYTNAFGTVKVLGYDFGRMKP